MLPTRILGTVLAAIALIALAPGGAAAQHSHTVEPGESLWSIAAANGIALEDLAAANGLVPDSSLLAGSVVTVPAADASTTAAAGSGACVWDCGSTVHPHPTDEVVGTGVLGDAAARSGMSDSLVEAVASVESGFDNSAVSSAGARGVMQIIPETWDYVDEVLAESPLDPASAAANVEAGVLYLHHLYHLKGGDREATIGSYYQGPNRDELLPETRTYIDVVDRRQAEIEAGG